MEVNMRVHITAFLLLALGAAVIVVEASEETEPHVAFVLAAEQAKGHLLVSHELYRDKQAARAALHASHPIREIGNRLIGPIRAVDPELGRKTHDLLRRPGQEIEVKVSTAPHEATTEQVFAALDEAIVRVVPASVRDEPAFHRQIIRALLDEVAAEYETAVKEGRITNPVEDQDAYGFFRRAAALRGELAARSPSDSGTDAAWKALVAVFPTATPPRHPVAVAVATVKARLAEAASGLGPDK
jgi:hypothetical protein